MTTQPCPACNGEGRYRTDDNRTIPCTRCKGTRTIPAGRENKDQYMHRDSTHGYTTEAALGVRGEQAAVPPEDIQHINDRWHEHHQALQAAKRPLHERLRELENTTPWRDLTALERRIAVLERKNAA